MRLVFQGGNSIKKSESPAFLEGLPENPYQSLNPSMQAGWPGKGGLACTPFLNYARSHALNTMEALPGGTLLLCMVQLEGKGGDSWTRLMRTSQCSLDFINPHCIRRLWQWE